MSFWSRVKNFFTGTPNTPPRVVPRGVSRETTPEDYKKELEKLTSRQDKIRALEATMFDDSLSAEVRKEALAEYTDITGWYRPESNNAWTSEEWKKWEEIYEAEEEVF